MKSSEPHEILETKNACTVQHSSERSVELFFMSCTQISLFLSCLSGSSHGFVLSAQDG